MNQSLLYGLATLGAGIVALIVRYAFKSKCTNVNLCYGLINITRDIEQEIESQEIEAHHPSKQSSNDNL